MSLERLDFLCKMKEEIDSGFTIKLYAEEMYTVI